MVAIELEGHDVFSNVLRGSLFEKVIEIKGNKT